MKLELTNWLQELDAEAAEEYNGLRRSLQRNSGFGLFFVQCSPATGGDIVAEIKKDISNKKIEVLHFDKPIDSLYSEIIALPDLKEIDILFISGLEHSLIEYENYTFSLDQKNLESNTEKRLTQDRQGVPRFLGYLNLQRDRFREEFDISFVFIVPIFGIDYFIKRAPDFFDWRSGFFRFIPQKDRLFEPENIDNLNLLQSRLKLLDLKTLNKELDFDIEEKNEILNVKSFLLLKCGRHKEAIAICDNALIINSNNDEFWFRRSCALEQLGRYEEAVASYDKGLEINPREDIAWFNRGYALQLLKKYEEAITSYDKSIAINLNDNKAWFLRSVALEQLGRYKEAVASCDMSLAFNSDYDKAWFSRGVALRALGRHEEAVSSFDKCLTINPNFGKVWFNLGYTLVMLERYEEAIVSCNKCLTINPNNYSAWFARGYILEKLDRHDEAVISYGKGLEINPNNFQAWLNRGHALGLLGRRKEAFQSFIKANEVNPEQYWKLIEEQFKTVKQIRLLNSKLHQFIQQIKLFFLQTIRLLKQR